MSRVLGILRWVINITQALSLATIGAGLVFALPVVVDVYFVDLPDWAYDSAGVAVLISLALFASCVTVGSASCFFLWALERFRGEVA